MKQSWQLRRVPVKFQVSDKTLFAKELTLQVREAELDAGTTMEQYLDPPAEPPEPGSAGYLIRSLPVLDRQPRLRWLPDFLVYVPSQYQRYYIDMQQSFSEYTANFSSKSRSTIKRKLNKFAKHSDGNIRWKCYRKVDEIHEFYRLARIISARTYQERLLDSGLPDSSEFQYQLETMAVNDSVRGYLLFDRDRPIAYLFCPVRNGALLYQYLGYDPDYKKWSAGMILHWLAFESMFNEGRFRLFDFTEGESELKRFFSTDSVRCANVYFIRRHPGYTLLVLAHTGIEEFSTRAGELLDRLKLKSRIRKFIRFGR